MTSPSLTFREVTDANVLNTASEGESWDMANAELLGLEEANGIIFNQNAQVLGHVGREPVWEPPSAQGRRNTA